MAITVDEVIQLSKAGVSAQKLIGVIEAERTVFELDAALIAKLGKAGVAEQVIVFMQKTPEHFAVSVEPLPKTLPKAKPGNAKPEPAKPPEQRVESGREPLPKPPEQRAKKTLLPPKASNLSVQPKIQMGLGPNSNHKRQVTKTGHRKYYRRHLLAVDLSSLALAYPTQGISAVGLIIGSPIVHAVHGNWGRAIGSLVLRAGLPVAGGFIGGAGGGGWEGLGMGVVLGGVVALVIDYNMAYKNIAPKKQAAFQFGTLSASPQLNITQKGGFSLGFNGRF